MGLRPSKKALWLFIDMKPYKVSGLSKISLKAAWSESWRTPFVVFGLFSVRYYFRDRVILKYNSMAHTFFGGYTYLSHV
jgi:hypothetical protein